MKINRHIAYVLSFAPFAGSKRKPPDIAHLPVKPGFAFIHAGSYDGANPPLRRESGILYGENDAEMHFAAAELLLSLG